MTMTRLHVLTGGLCAAAYAVSDRKAAQAIEPFKTRSQADLVTQLVNTNYFDVIRLSVRAGDYFSHDFNLTPEKRDANWSLQSGVYNTLRGYWIFWPNRRKCWQAGNTSGPLRYWNQDGKATGNPEDWELFVFELINLREATVRIRNVYGRYVRYRQDRFVCDGPSITDGTTFVAHFN